MNDRFLIAQVYICPVYRNDENCFLRDLNYPTRLCVIDNKNKIVVDVEDKLKYDYFKVINGKYIEPLPCEYNGERIAIFTLMSINNCITNEALNVLEGLKNGKSFENGNDVYKNDEYLEHLQNNVVAQKAKSKKFSKIKNFIRK